MALTRKQKEEKVATMKQALASAVSVVFVAYDSLTVEHVEELRDALYADKSTLKVVPKRLLRLALQQHSIAFDPTQSEGQVALIWGDDEIAPARVLVAFMKKHKDTLRLLAGLLNQEVLTSDRVAALAQLGTLDQMRGMAVGTMAAPVRNFVSLLSGVSRSLVTVLDGIAKQKS